MMNLKSACAAAVALLLLSPVQMFAGDGKENSGQHDDKEVAVAIKDLPKSVVDAVNAARPGATLVEADQETRKDGTPVYEIDVTQGGKKFEVKVDGAGKILSNKEDVEDEKDEKDEAKK